MTVQQLSGGIDRFAAAIGTRLDGAPLVVMLDIDGTLAPIALTPTGARIPGATRETLRRLVALPDVSVAFVSGRSAADTLRMVPVDDAWIIGNHGLELRTPEGDVTASPEARKYEAAVADAARTLASVQSTIPGTILEDKRWSLSLHYRLVDQGVVPIVMERAREAADATGLRITEGKKVVELRPPVRVDKGTAAVALAERLHAVDEPASLLYAGDDRTDEDAFRALRTRHPRAVTVRIMAADEGPTNAEFILASPDELRQVLEWLVARRTRAPRGT